MPPHQLLHVHALQQHSVHPGVTMGKWPDPAGTAGSLCFWGITSCRVTGQTVFPCAVLGRWTGSSPSLGGSSQRGVGATRASVPKPCCRAEPCSASHRSPGTGWGEAMPACPHCLKQPRHRHSSCQPRASCSTQRSSHASAWGRACRTRPTVRWRPSCRHCRSKQPAAKLSRHRAGRQALRLAVPGTARAQPGFCLRPLHQGRAAWGCHSSVCALGPRELAAWLQAELSQWQWKQQVTLEQALQHMHAAAHAEEKLQRSQEQLQALREQVGSGQDLLWGPSVSLAPVSPAPMDNPGPAQCQEQATAPWELQGELCCQQDGKEKF